MPRVDIRIKDTEPSVTRPVAFEVIRNVLEETGLVANTSILFPHGEVGYQPSTTLSAKLQQREKNLFSNDKRVFLEIDEQYADEDAVAGAVMRAENRFVFTDDDLDCYLKPSYSTVNATLTVRYRAKDRIEAMRWRDGVRGRVQMGRRELLHQVSYSYLIPDAALLLLSEIHRLRENVMGYGEDFETYKNQFFTDRKTTVVTVTGTEPKEVIAERARRIIGSFDFGLRPERAERDGQGDTWTISFSYHYTYMRPINMVMYYPIVVHNQLLPEKYRVNHRTDRDDFHALSTSFSTSAFRYFEPDRLVDMWQKTRGVYLPEFDDFVPSAVLLNSLRIFTGLVILDMNNPELLMNFGELGDWTLDPVIKTFLASEAQYTKRQYNSVFDLSFYRNRALMNENLDMIELHDNLDVILKEPVSLRNYFHVRLGLCSDLSLLNPDAKDRLRDSSCVFKVIANAINPFIDIDSLLSTLDTCGSVSDKEWDDVVNAINNGNGGGMGNTDPSARLGYNTVQNFFINSKLTIPGAPLNAISR